MSMLFIPCELELFQSFSHVVRDTTCEIQLGHRWIYLTRCWIFLKIWSPLMNCFLVTLFFQIVWATKLFYRPDQIIYVWSTYSKTDFKTVVGSVLLDFLEKSTDRSKYPSKSGNQELGKRWRDICRVLRPVWEFFENIKQYRVSGG